MAENNKKDLYGTKSEFDDLIKSSESKYNEPQITDEYNEDKHKKPGDFGSEKKQDKTLKDMETNRNIRRSASAPPPPPAAEKRQNNRIAKNGSETNHNAPRPSFEKFWRIFWVVLIFVSIAVLIFAQIITYKNRKAKKQKVMFGKTSSQSKPAVSEQKITPDETLDVTSFSLSIVGSDSFKERVKEGLKLIFIYDREMFKELKSYIYVIREGHKTDFVIENDAPKILLTAKTAGRSPTWCAGAIAHQLYLAKNYYSQKSKGIQLPPPGQSMDLEVEANPNLVDVIDSAQLERLEKKADDYQALLMIKTGAPTYEIKLIRSRPYGDYSLTHDGRY